MTLEELYEALKAAEGPSRELDIAIAKVITPKEVVNEHVAIYPAYTSSLDAITALVEERLPGCTRETTHNSVWIIVTILGQHGSFAVTHSVDRRQKPNVTEALAISTAFVKALMEQEGSK